MSSARAGAAALRSTSVSSRAGQGERVVPAGVEVGELVDPVEHVCDQLAQEQPRRDADLAAELAGDGTGQLVDVGVVDRGRDPLGMPGLPGVQVADGAAQLAEPGEVEPGQPQLHRARGVEARIGGEVGGQPLGERRQPLHALLAVEERRRAGDDEEQAGEAPGVDLVDELAQRVEALLPDVAAHPLQRLDLVEDEQQAGVAAVAQHGQQALEEAQRGEVVEVPAHAGGPAGGRGHRALPAEPGDERLGGGGVAGEPGAAVAAQGGGERRSGPRDRGEPLLHQLVDGGGERRRRRRRATSPASSTSSSSV